MSTKTIPIEWIFFYNFTIRFVLKPISDIFCYYCIHINLTLIDFKNCLINWKIFSNSNLKTLWQSCIENEFETPVGFLLNKDKSDSDRVKKLY